MWNVEALTLPNSSSSETSFTLSQEIPAMQLIPVGNGSARPGPISKLPKDATIEVFGEGFNDRTLKVRYRDLFYFVFLSDLDVKAKAAASAQ